MEKKVIRKSFPKPSLDGLQRVNGQLPCSRKFLGGLKSLGISYSDTGYLQRSSICEIMFVDITFKLSILRVESHFIFCLKFKPAVPSKPRPLFLVTCSFG